MAEEAPGREGVPVLGKAVSAGFLLGVCAVA